MSQIQNLKRNRVCVDLGAANSDGLGTELEDRVLFSSLPLVSGITFSNAFACLCLFSPFSPLLPGSVHLCGAQSLVQCCYLKTNREEFVR